jgi:NAD+ synthase
MLPSEYTSQSLARGCRGVATRSAAGSISCRSPAPRGGHRTRWRRFSTGTEPDITEENIQSRLRGLLLMALSNKFGEMLLTTGNKSEVAVGYATIYGDMAGGYNPIKDLYKTRVFETCRWRNANIDLDEGPGGRGDPGTGDRQAAVGRAARGPEGQRQRCPLTRCSTHPRHPRRQDGSIADCVAAGFDARDCQKVEHLIYISEYKRFQSAPGARLTKRAFWLDRRYPIVNRWRDRRGLFGPCPPLGPADGGPAARPPARGAHPIRHELDPIGRKTVLV